MPLGVPAHTPALQTSPSVLASPSSHGVPSGVTGFEQVAFSGSQTPASWHWSWAVQTTGLTAVHVPPWQVSLCVQASPSLHPVSSALLGFEHSPVPGLHVPASWHWSGAGQVTELPAVHVPPWQVSLSVQASPSLHPVPSALLGFEHSPVPGLHVPASWHWSGAGQVTELPAVHVPPWQVSLSVQASPSLHPAPSALLGFEHSPVPGLHVPASWHWSCAVQVTEVPAVHVPPWQVSLSVQASPSLHPVPSGLLGLEHSPVAGLHVPASWHWSCAVQTTGSPVHVPPWQVSVCVQASPSSHPPPSGIAIPSHEPVVQTAVAG